MHFLHTTYNGTTETFGENYVLKKIGNDSRMYSYFLGCRY